MDQAKSGIIRSIYFNPNWTGEVKVDLADFDLKVQENLLSTGT